MSVDFNIKPQHLVLPDNTFLTGLADGSAMKKFDA